ncbi:MAG: HAD family hydrolase [Phycisphaerales bacterium]|nr:MAG: HAD family hydrolase [Phycisphaerales bacterium]
MIKAVIFDLDDTLYDEMEYCKSGFNAVARFLAGLPDAPPAASVFDALWRQFNAGNRTRTFNAALDQIGFSYDSALVGRLVQVYRGHEPDITLPTESRDVLDTLADKYPLGLLTDGFLPAQELKVRRLRIEHYFQHILYTERLGRQFWKPSPAGFEKLISLFGADPPTMAYVADNEKKDFIAPNRLGFVTVRIIRPKRIHTESSTQPADRARHTIRRIGRLPALLAAL